MIIKNLFMNRKNLIIFSLFLTISCSTEKASHTSFWTISDGLEYPENKPLSRAEDGVILSDGTLIVADQRYGLAKIDLSGKVTPFGNFDALDYEQNPPKVESGPNGVHLSPDKKYVLTADVFNGKIYKSCKESEIVDILVEEIEKINL